MAHFQISEVAQNQVGIHKQGANYNEIIGSRNIYIIGGHETWGKRIKDKYPTINLVDGNNRSFDATVLSNADFVFFNVGYMSHALYYKSIDFIRRNHIKFDFVGRSNQDLLDKEMVSLIKKYNI